MITKIQEIIKARDADAFFISHSTNILYLTDFIGIAPEERESFVVITRKSATLIVSQMYKTQAKKLRLVKDGSVRLAVTDQRNAFPVVLSKILSHNDIVLFEGHNLTVEELNSFKYIAASRWRDARRIIEGMRIIKTAQEIRKIKQAVQLTDTTLERLVHYLKHAGSRSLTEHDIALKIGTISRDLGGEGLGFDSIIASGPSSAEPHYRTSNVRVRNDAALLIDFGIKHSHYSGDLTRTFFVGSASKKMSDAYNHVRHVNELCIKACGPNIKVSVLDRVAREYFKQYKLDDYFVHSLGHGLGIDIHEQPSLNLKNDQVLKPGMVITIEPGLYFPRQFGVRIEDVVLVTETGCEILSKSPKELVELR